MVDGVTCSGEEGNGDRGGIPVARTRAGGSPFGLRTSPRFTWEGEIASNRLEDCEAAVRGTGLHTGRRALRAREIEAPPKLRRGVHRGRRWQHMVAAHWCFVQCPRESPAFFGRSMCFTRM